MDYAKIREFYNQLEDEESRLIFEHRIKYLFTDDRKHLCEMINNANRLFHPAKTVRNIRYLLNHPVDYPLGAIIYGAGETSKYCHELIQNANIKVRAFCDRRYEKLQAEGHLGLPVISPKELMTDSDYKKCAIVVSSLLYHHEISDSLIENGFSNDSIFIMEGQYNFTNYIHGDMYFDDDFMKPSDNEVFVDVGCYDGHTIKQFDRFCSGNYRKIFGFEPHPGNYQRTVDNLKKLGIRDAEIIQKGAWSSDSEYAFVLEYGQGLSAARINETGDAVVQTTTIDKIVGTEWVTFIKMDIEGAELEALKGARNVISRCKPKLAICLYHKPEDIIEIPEFIYGLAPDYKFYIRHYNYIRSIGDIALDTVLYAVCTG